MIENDMLLLENKKVAAIVEAAKVEFAINGIINSKLKDIAKRANVGEATLYRNFKDKTALAKLVAFVYWKEESIFFEEYMKNNIKDTFTGLEKLVGFVTIFNESFKSHQEFLKFLEDFDNYMMRIENTEGPSSFEEMILTIKDVIKSFVIEGVNDGSLKPGLDPEEVYELISQVYIPSLQKMVIRVGYLKSDEGLNPLRVLDNLTQMLICVCENQN